MEGGRGGGREVEREREGGEELRKDIAMLQEQTEDLQEENKGNGAK